MKWQEIQEKLYYRDGSLRDIYVKGTNVQDNQKWINYVNSNFRIECLNEIENKVETKIDFNLVKSFWEKDLEYVVTGKVFIDESIQVNNYFFCYSEIENDIDPREIKTIEDHNKIVNYMNTISNLLNKSIILTPENTPEIILMKIENDVISYK